MRICLKLQPYSKFFWSVFSRIQAEYGEMKSMSVVVWEVNDMYSTLPHPILSILWVPGHRPFIIKELTGQLSFQKT